MEILGINEHTTLDLKGVVMTITVKILPNNPVIVDINALDTIDELKKKIEEKELILVNEQHLYVYDKEIFDNELLESRYITLFFGGGMELQNELTLNDYGIYPDAAIHLVILLGADAVII